MNDTTRQQWLCRALVVTGLSILASSYLRVLYTAVDIDGDPRLFFGLVAGAVIAGLIAGRFVPISGAIVSGAIITALGSMLYISTIPPEYSLSLTISGLWGDTTALLTGMSILRIINAGMWAVAVAPIPTFLVSYFATRRQFGYSTLIGCGTVAFVVLTGDISGTDALLGVLGGVFTLGVDGVERRGARVMKTDRVLVVLALVLVVTASISIVPGGSAPLGAGGSTGSGETVEASLTRSDDELSVGGSIKLSPDVRFTVESDRESYWRIGAYDRYTGDGWVRTADTHDPNDELTGPKSGGSKFTQTVSPRATLSVMPAAWRPISVSGPAADATSFGGLRPEGRLQPGDNYTVESIAPRHSPRELRNASGSYPDDLRDRYTQLPDSTPDDVSQYTEQLTANAETPYDSARVISTHLKEHWNYSLSVPEPDGQVASTFLFDREAGYCTYFATTMVTMLRSQEIPARLAVGYAPGQRVGQNEWVVRGLDAHAWVEVYFQDVGWVRFDPTPAEPRQQAEQAAIAAAREDDAANVDVSSSDPNETDTPTPTPTPEPTASTATEAADQSTATPGDETTPETGPASAYRPEAFANASAAVSDDDGGSTVELPPASTILFGITIAGGLLALLRRWGVFSGLRRLVWLWNLSRSDPKADVAAVYDRLEYLLTREHRPREPGETRREYVRDVGTREDRRLVAIYEQVIYAGDRSDSLVSEAIELFKRRRWTLVRW